jgi:hypothetical protein
MQGKKSAITLTLAVFCLALISAAQTAPQPAPTTLTPQEREFALKQFETTADNFLKSIAGLSQKQWTFKPAPDRWPIAEVAEHITVSESALGGLVEQQLMLSSGTGKA